MRSSIATALAALAFACNAAPASATDPLVEGSACAGADVRRQDRAAEATAVHCLVNAARARAGLAPVQRSAGLTKLARKRRDLLIRCDDFSHRPCGRRLNAWSYTGSASRASVGENLQWHSGASTTPREIVSNWLASPSHRGSILNAQWRHGGFAGARGVRFHGRRRASVWVQLFGRRAGN